MSSTSSTDADRLNIAEQLERIDRMRRESDKFTAEQAKLMAEQVKLLAEAAKLQRDTHLAPWLVGGAVAGGILTGATLLLRALGVLS